MRKLPVLAATASQDAPELPHDLPASLLRASTPRASCIVRRQGQSRHTYPDSAAGCSPQAPGVPWLSPQVVRPERSHRVYLPRARAASAPGTPRAERELLELQRAQGRWGVAGASWGRTPRSLLARQGLVAVGHFPSSLCGISGGSSEGQQATGPPRRCAAINQPGPSATYSSSAAAANRRGACISLSLLLRARSVEAA